MASYKYSYYSAIAAFKNDGLLMYRCSSCNQKFDDIVAHVKECSYTGPFRIGVRGYNHEGKLGFFSLQFHGVTMHRVKQLVNNGYDLKINFVDKLIIFESDFEKITVKEQKKGMQVEEKNECGKVIADFEVSGQFEFTEQESKLFKELMKYLPDAVKEISKTDSIHSQRIVDMFELISDGTFPYANITFLLFEDVISWFKCNDIRQIRYSEVTKRFWNVGYMLFKNKFLEFMRGPQFKGKHVDTGETLSPNDCDINFAVPDSRTLSDSGVVPDNLEPGVLNDVINVYSSHENAFNTSQNLSADLKSINPSKVDRLGMVDLSGYERVYKFTSKHK